MNSHALDSLLAIEKLLDQSQLDATPAHRDQRAGQASSSEKHRQHERVGCQRSAVAIPVMPNGSLDLSHRFTAKLVDVSCGGLGLELETASDTVPQTLLIGVATDQGRMRFEGVEVCHSGTMTPYRKRVGGKFDGAGHQILQQPLLTPILDPQMMQYRMPDTLRGLDGWVEAGVLSPRLLDRVLVCPRCDTLPTFRQACRACKSGRIGRERLVHHFACAHVDRVEAFTKGNEIVCPKCLRRNLVVGADFDFQQGPVVCVDCRWSDSEAASVGHCLRCGYRFSAEQAKDQELIGYDVQRLDVLALLSAS